MSHTVRAVPVFLALAALFCLSVRPAVAQPAVSYLGVDVFGGLAPHTRNNAPEDAESFNGWGVGGTVRFLPWLGATGTYGQSKSDSLRLRHVLAGATVTSRFCCEYWVRPFAQVLAGTVQARPAGGGLSESGLELVAGAGFDFFAFGRFQIDYVRLNLEGPAAAPMGKNNLRLWVGGVVPLCFRGCRPDSSDGYVAK